ncbi:plastocyanin/azurin family copper-binding protein [Pelagicoccus sp. SDUM812003]|uniref:plastocyanin/azurin family copper-binding protein n=1 Tax=Pelagicoccus sp. SDUM812003 TaxID=3041267 RepID=UPI00280CF41F|nr:plastocyanin/azurin family copper-binding protein [Pelagicoccus sp. SDUM812003]MDQ8202218.1 plastocyanin/azurin family copper-binding protein [Pelagicoccus sp. SDUM812003]
MKNQKTHFGMIALLLACISLFLTACGDKASTSSSGQSGSSNADAPAKEAETPEPSREIVVEANDQMKFDKTEIIIAPGETVKLTLNNVGTMPKFSMGHNLVILDKAADVAAFAEASAMSPANEYISPDFQDKVVAATALLGGGETDSVVFTAPKTRGDYPFLCSFPGHVQAGMKGLLKVQ